MNDYTSKYFGVLRHIQEDFVNKNVFKEILKFNLFDEFPLSKSYLNDSYFGLELELEDFKGSFNDFFLYNNKEYNLKSSVWNDMFNFHAYMIELKHEMSDFEINNFALNFHSLTTKDEKLDLCGYCREMVMALDYTNTQGFFDLLLFWGPVQNKSG